MKYNSIKFFTIWLFFALGILQPCYGQVNCRSVTELLALSKSAERKENTRNAYLLTERLEIKQLSIADLPAVLKLMADPEVQSMSGDFQDVSASKLMSHFEFMHQILGFITATNEFLSRSDANLDIVLLGVYAEKKLTGIVQIYRGTSKFDGQGLDLSQAYLLGYHFFPTVWGKGYATEAGNRVIRYTFENLGATKMHATALKSNFGSQAVLRKLGFEVLPVDHPEYLLFRKSLHK